MFKSILMGVAVVLSLLIVAYIGRLVYLVQTTNAPAGHGTGAALVPCPTQRPNCVSSLNNEADFQAAPFSFSGDVSSALKRLKAAIATEPRAEIVFANETRIDVTFKTALFGFRDDAGFAIDPAAGLIHFHSKSRVGYSDLGVNRKRIERLRAAFVAAQ